MVINHYHRPGVTYPSAIPLNPYGADIIAGFGGWQLGQLVSERLR